MKANYHMHTYRCHHASGKDEDYVKAAIAGGYDVIGFSDHCCWNYNSDFVSSIRMTVEEFDEYYESVMTLKEKYKNKIEIRIGMECEYFPAYMDWLKDFVKEKKLDYIILGNHFDTSDETGVYYGTSCEDDVVLAKYVDDAIAGLKTGLYSYLAHPDLFMRGRSRFDEVARRESIRLCKFCKEKNIPIEYNLEGKRVGNLYRRVQYPYDDFWKIAAEIGNSVIIGVDAHESESMADIKAWDDAVVYLDSLGLKRIDTIDYKW